MTAAAADGSASLVTTGAPTAGMFDGLALLRALHRDGGLSVATVRVESGQCVARSTLYPDGDLTTRLHASATPADAARHFEAIRAQSDAIGRARKSLIAWVSVVGAGGVLAATGWGTESDWLTWTAGSGLAAQAVASLRFLWKTRRPTWSTRAQ